MKTGKFFKQDKKAYEDFATPSSEGIVSGETYKNLIHTSSSGIVSGGAMTASEDLATFSVSGGSGYIINNDESVPSIVTVTWDDRAELVPEYMSTHTLSFIFIEPDGSLVYKNELNPPSGDDYRNRIYLGRLAHNPTAILAVITEVNVCYDPGSSLRDIFDYIASVNLEGNKIEPISGGLTLTKTAGHTLRAGTNFGNDRNNPNIITSTITSPITLRYRYHDGTRFQTLADRTTLRSNLYNPDGTFANVSEGCWTITHIGFSSSSNTLLLLAPEFEFNSYEDAFLNLFTSPIKNIDPAFRDVSFLGYIIAKGDATDLSDMNQAVIFNSDKDRIYSDKIMTKEMMSTGSSNIDDESTANDKVWSSNKTDSEVTNAANAAAEALIDDDSTTTESVWSSTKITNETAAQATSAAQSLIDDTASATDSVFSSTKTLSEIASQANTAAGALIDDSSSAVGSVWSSTKTTSEIASQATSAANAAAEALIDDDSTTTESVWSSTKTTNETAAQATSAAQSLIDDAASATDSVFSSTKTLSEIASQAATAAGALIDDSSSAVGSVWSSTKTTNEIVAAVGGLIDDTSSAVDKVFSSNKTLSEINALILDTSSLTSKVWSASKLITVINALIAILEAKFTIIDAALLGTSLDPDIDLDLP